MEFESKFSCKTLRGKLLHAIIFVSFAVMLSACGDNKEEKPQSRPIAEVTVATPVVTSITNYNIFTGNTVAVESVDIVARVEGFLESVDFEPSTIVKKAIYYSRLKMENIKHCSKMLMRQCTRQKHH